MILDVNICMYTVNLSFIIKEQFMKNIFKVLFAIALIMSIGMRTGCGSKSSSNTKITTRPNPPTGLVQTTVNKTPQVNLSWNASTGAKSYSVYSITTTTACPTSGYTYAGSASGMAYTDTNLISGTTYCFAVTAKNSAGESGYSNITTATILAVPSLITAGVPNETSASLTWDGSTHATSYNVYTSTTSGSYPYPPMSVGHNTSYTVTGLTPWYTYYFIVTAVNGNGETGYSNQKGVYLAQLPNGLNAFPGPEQATLNWNATISPIQYNIYDDAGYVGFTTGTYTSFTATSLTDGNSYNFTVTAVYAGGESSGSNPTSTIPMAAPLVAAIEPTYNTVLISWGTSAGASSFNGYEQQSPGGTWARIFTGVTGSQQLWAGATDGLTYNFTVTAINSLGQEGSVSNVSGLTLTPDAPTGLAASAGYHKASLTWNGSAGATGYNIYITTTSTFTQDTASGTSSIERGLANYTVYYFTITAYNGSGESKPSNKVTATPQVISYNYVVGFQPVDIAIDAYGSVWAVNLAGNSVSELNYAGGLIDTYGVQAYPIGIAIDASGNIWIVNECGTSAYCTTGSVTELNPAGSAIGTYPVGYNPMSIAIDASGNVWVANNVDNNVMKLNSTGALIHTYGVGTQPHGIAIDASGNVWVTNESSNNVTELNSSGALIHTYGVGTQPHGIAIDASGNVWVANNAGNTISEITSITSVPVTTTVTGGFNAPEGIAIDASGNIWVTNNGSSNVTELNSTGGVIGTYAVVSAPTGIAIDASGNVWVANNTVSKVTEFVGITTGPQYWPYTGPVFPGGGNW